MCLTNTAAFLYLIVFSIYLTFHISLESYLIISNFVLVAVKTVCYRRQI